MIDERLASELDDRDALEQELGRGGVATVYRAQGRKHDPHPVPHG